MYSSSTNSKRVHVRRAQCSFGEVENLKKRTRNMAQGAKSAIHVWTKVHFSVFEQNKLISFHTNNCHVARDSPFLHSASAHTHFRRKPHALHIPFPLSHHFPPTLPHSSPRKKPISLMSNPHALLLSPILTSPHYFFKLTPH